MPSTYSSLKIQLMATGENNTTWGDVTNVNLGTALEEAIVGSADVAFSNANVTLTLTDTNSTQTARNMRLNLTGTATAGYNLVVPAIEKPYIVNNGTDGTITVKNSTGTGVAVPAGRTMWVYNNGTNVVDVTSYLSSLTLGSALGVASGGTGTNTLTSGYLLKGNGTSAVSASIVYDSGTLVGVGAGTAAKTRLQVSAAGTLNAPVLGSATGAPLYVTSSDPAYGLIAGTSASDGHTWLQAQRTDGTATAYNITLNEAGGNVGIGTSSPGTRLHVQDTETTVRLTATSGRIWDLISGGGGNVGANFFAIRDTSSGANVVQIAPQASEAMRINASGNVGIGTSSPGARLDVRAANIADGTNGGIVNVYSTTAQAANVGGKLDLGGLYDGSNSLSFASVAGRKENSTSGDWSGYMQFSTRRFGGDFAERMRIDSSGNLGIGTSSPARTLSVYSASSIPAQIESSGTDARISIVTSSGSGGQGFIQASSGALLLGSSNTERARITSDGSMQLSVGGVSNTHQFLYNESGGEIQLVDSTGAGPILLDNSGGLARLLKVGSGSIAVGTTSTGSLVLQTADIERMRVNGSGNVGIGTSTPSQKLDVTTASGDDGIAVVNSSSSGGRIRLNSTGTGGRNYHINSTANSSGDGGGKFVIRDSTASDAARLAIDSSGNVGIGTASPSGFGSNITTLDIEGSSGSGIKLGTGSPTFGIYYNGGNAYLQTLNASPLLFATNNAERARIDTSGNLLVGTTAPLGGNTSNEFKNTTAGSWPLTLNSNDRGLLMRQSAAGSGYYAYFEYNGGTNNGSISWSGGTTAYNTTSDARIKENIVDAPEAGSLIDNIKVRSWDFKADGNHWRYGMVAQELLEVAPEAVSVPEDEEQMMGVDYSKLVPMLIKEVQSLRARVAQLEGN